MGFFRNWPQALGRRWRDRAIYRTTWDWLLSVYDRLLKRAPGAPLPGRKAIRKVNVNGFDWPLYARLGSTDFLVIEELFVRHEYHFLFDGRLGPVKRILDLGSNCGYSVLLWLRHFPEARIVAVEPDPNNAAVLRRNVVARDPEGRVTVIEACAAGSSRTVYLDRSLGEWEFSLSESNKPGSVSVQALTVPQILERAGLSDGPIDFLKCDIEGAERELFVRPADWLPRIRNLLVEVHEPYSADDLCQAVAAASGDFHAEVISPPGPQRLVLFRQQ